MVILLSIILVTSLPHSRIFLLVGQQLDERKLDPFHSYLEGRIREGAPNGQKLYRELLGQGYSGKAHQVRRFVQPFRAARQRQEAVRFETAPGQQGQVAWGSFGLIEHQGQQRRLYGFVMMLGWSRTMYVEFTVAADIAWWLRCHQHAFAYIGGVPREMLHDNLKTAGLARGRDGVIHWHPRYLDFAHAYGFSLRACQPYRAHRPKAKSKVVCATCGAISGVG
jgi:transposase